MAKQLQQPFISKTVCYRKLSYSVNKIQIINHLSAGQQTKKQTGRRTQSLLPTLPTHQHTISCLSTYKHT